MAPSAVLLDDGVLEQHPPRLRDAAEWSAARLANRSWLERSFPAWGDDWAAEQSTSAWVRRWRTLRRSSGVRPATFRLDGRLIGEIGVDALDERTNTAEGSAWLVRDHGGPGVMQAACLLMIREAFTGPRPADRLIAPVVSTNRQALSPSMSAVGFRSEATVPRPVGHGDAVDHDIWLVHNTAAVRADTERRLRALGRAVAPVGHRTSAREIAALVPAVARVAIRDGLTGRRRPGPAPDPTQLVPHVADVGTATAQLAPSGNGTNAEVLAEVRRVADDAETWAPRARAVEVLLAPDVAWLAGELPALGFAHVATFPPTPDGSGRYPGEQVWRRDR